VISYAKGQKQFKELQTTRDFNHQSEPITFDTRKTKIDSLLVICGQNLSNPEVNRIKPLTIKAIQVEKCLTTGNYTVLPIFKKNGLGIDFIHEENDYIDFLVQN
jgi:hypothetical protein